MNVETTRPRRVLITRSREGNSELAPKIRKMGFEPLAIDLLELTPPQDWREVDGFIAHLESYDWLAFTSGVAVRFFSARAASLHLSLSKMPTKVACIGPKTAEAASAAGISVGFVPSRALGLTLGQELPGGARVLLLRGDISDGSLPETLRARGFQVDEAVMYFTGKGHGSTELVDEADLIIFGSPSSVANLCSRLSEPARARAVKKVAACIGPVTARAARSHGFSRVIQPTEEYTFDSLLEQVRRLDSVA
jgi:uroporphyrinogen-III synthase